MYKSGRLIRRFSLNRLWIVSVIFRATVIELCSYMPCLRDGMVPMARIERRNSSLLLGLSYFPRRSPIASISSECSLFELAKNITVDHIGL